MAKLAYHFEAGGWAMWLILICLVVAIGFSVERAMYLYKSAIDKDEFIAKMQRCITSGDVAGAIKVCSAEQTLIAPATSPAVMHFCIFAMNSSLSIDDL